MRRLSYVVGFLNVELGHESDRRDYEVVQETLQEWRL